MMDPTDILSAVGSAFFISFAALILGKLFTAFVGATSKQEQSAYDRAAIGMMLGILGFVYAFGALSDPDKVFLAKLPEATLCFLIAIIGAQLFSRGYKAIPQKHYVEPEKTSKSQATKWWMIDEEAVE